MSNLETLFHHRWAVPILAELDRTAGSRFVVLVNRLGLSRESLRQTLAALIDEGLVMRNPGYGHPLRPEYVLTERGQSMAPHCSRILAALRRLGLEEVGLKKWSMPVVSTLDGGARRFSELRALLPGVSPRALTLTLKELGRAGLVARRVTDDYPPATLYASTPAGRRLHAILAQLATG
jgi:DNA-binding HxlR family transcriptional regulator